MSDGMERLPPVGVECPLHGQRRRARASRRRRPELPPVQDELALAPPAVDRLARQDQGGGGAIPGDALELALVAEPRVVDDVGHDRPPRRGGEFEQRTVTRQQEGAVTSDGDGLHVAVNDGIAEVEVPQQPAALGIEHEDAADLVVVREEAAFGVRARPDTSRNSRGMSQRATGASVASAMRRWSRARRVTSRPARACGVAASSDG